MSLSQLLERDLQAPEYKLNRNAWHAEVARRALSEAKSKEAQRLLVKVLLEGGLTPWSLGYDFFPNDGLTTMMWIAAGGSDPKQVFDTLKKRYAESEPRCQEVWTGEHVAYRCFTCGISENSCMCVFCFDVNDHINHEYRLYSSTAGGCCDCGDPQAWRESGFCKRHRSTTEKRPSMISQSIASGSKLACRAVVEHLIWALRRCFFLGKRRPERSGAFGIIRCFEWLSEVTSVCPELCRAASDALHEKRDVLSEVIGWGNYCSAFASEMVTDETGTAALLRLGCYLPDPISFELGAMFLKLLLEPQYKAVFTVDFVQYLREYLGLLLNGETPEEAASRWGMTLASAISPTETDNNQMWIVDVEAIGEIADDVDEDDEEESSSGRSGTNLFIFGSNKPPHYTLPKSPAVLSNMELSRNARQFMDRIYCQLFHSEAIALTYSQPLLTTMLPKLRDFFNSCLVPNTKVLRLTKVRNGKHFYRRVLSQLNLILQHDSVCLKILESDELWQCVLDIIASTQLMDTQRRRSSTEDHIPHPSFLFKTSFGLLFEIEEQLVRPLLHSIKSVLSGPDQVNFKSYVLRRLAMTRNVLRRWTEDHELDLRSEDCFSAHVILNRFFFRYLHIAKDLLPQEEVIRAVWPDMTVEEDGTPTKWAELMKFVIPCLRVLSFVFQIQENQWVRNGQTMFNTVLWYMKIFSAGTLEGDLLACRVSLQLCPDDFVDELFQRAQDVLSTANAVRVFGSLALMGPTTSSVRRCAVHCLAARNCSFSELDNQCPPKSSRELEQVLQDIADFHDASAHPGGSPAHYTLKPHVWDEVEFGGFYLRWMRMDEESALTRFRRAKNKKEAESFFPITRFPDNEIATKIFRSVSIRGACIRLCALSNPDTAQRGHQLSTVTNEADVKTMCCILMIAALASLKRSSQVESSGSNEDELDMFPRQSFLDLIPLLEASVPTNVLEIFQALLQEDEPSAGRDAAALSYSSQNESEVIMANPEATLTTATTSENAEGDPSGSAKLSAASKSSSKAARAQQKAMRAFAKKQKKVQFDDEGLGDGVTGVGSGEAASTSAASSKEEDPVCALCRKTVQDSNECLTLLVCRQGSSLLHTLESIALEGEGRCVARTGSTATGNARRSTSEVIQSEEQPYMAPRSVLTCIHTLRDRFNTGEYSSSPGTEGRFEGQRTSEEQEESYGWLATAVGRNNVAAAGEKKGEEYTRSVNSTRHLIHSCGHLLHQSCLGQYRQVVLSRSQSNQPFEGQGVIKLSLNELFCPVCRRVTNDFIPLLPQKDLTVVEEDSHLHSFETQSDWIRERLQEYRVCEIQEALVSFDEYAEEVREFFRRCPTVIPKEGKSPPYLQFDPAGLILTHLYSAAASSTVPPPTLKATVAPLMNLALRHPHLPSCSAETLDFGVSDVQEQMIELWAKFVNERFWGERPGRRRRQSALSADLSVVLVEWLVTCPWLRFSTLASSSTSPQPQANRSSPVIDEGKRVFRFLLFFARMQDLLITEVYKQAKAGLKVKEEAMELSPGEDLRSSSKHSDALRVLALRKALDSLDDLTVLHRLNQKERTQLEANVNRVVTEFLRGNPDGMDQTTTAAAVAVEQLVMDHFPRDCLPFIPTGPASETRVESLTRNAVILLGQDAVSEAMAVGDDERSVVIEIMGVFMRKVLTTFVKELVELVGGDERPAGGSELVAAILKTSAMMPVVMATPSARFSTFLRLPSDFSLLTVSYVARAAFCSRCQKPPEYPAICLCCGDLVCCNGPCCYVGGVDELFLHGAKCSRGAGKNTGVFLLIKTCVVIVLLGENRHCVWGSLYLDTHDEEDRNLTRGKPLTLNTERLDALEKVHKTQSWLMETKVLDYVRLS